MLRLQLASMMGLCVIFGANAVGEIKLSPWGTDAVRVQMSLEAGDPIAEPVRSALLPNPPVRHQHNTTFDGPSTVIHGNLRVSVDTSGLVTATRISDGVVLLEQVSLKLGDATPGSRQGSKAVTATFKGLKADERLYGLGEHANGKVNQAVGGYNKIFADSLYYGKSRGGDVSIPWYMTSNGYGFIWNLPSLGSVSLSTSGITWVSNATKSIDMWITTTSKPTVSGQSSSNAMAQLLHNYVDVVGHAMPMPFWSTGFIQCKDRYRNQSQLLNVARGYAERGLPVSMIVIDWFHWVNMGDWALNPHCWPDPQAMVDELRSLGIELMVTTWPYMGINASIHWKEFLDNDYLANSTQTNFPDSFWGRTGNALVDPSNPSAMSAVQKHWYEGYGKYGIKAIWLDEAEPDHSKYISGGQWKLKAGIDSEMLPAWVSYWQEGFYSMFHNGAVGDDFFVLSRNAWAGTWRFGAALWSGDVFSTFDALSAAVKAGQGVALSGLPLWTTDIGGYSGGDPEDPVFQQLIVRWFQFGAFCPLFRLHGHRHGGPPENECGVTNGDNEVWNLAKDPEHYDAITAVMHLRESLREYVKRLNDEAVATGMPMMRPMTLQFPDDEACSSTSNSTSFFVERQFMLGDEWLVSPVTEHNATEWRVYLPSAGESAERIYWWNQTSMPAGWHSMDVSAIGSFPLFVRRPINASSVNK